MTGQATSDVEAVRLTDGTLENVDRIGISDHMREDGTAVHPPAQIQVERICPD